MKEIEFALLKGDSVTTPELKAAHMHFENLNRALGELGQRWHFAFGESNRLAMMCNDYLRARKRRS